MKVIGIDGYNSYIANNFINKYKKKYKIYKFREDINNLKKLKTFIKQKQITVFIRCAGLSRTKCENNKSVCNKTNYKANQNLIDYLKINKIKLIFLSSCHVYKISSKKIKESSIKKPNSLYGKLKLKSENYLRKNLSNFLIIRLFNIHGKDQPNGFFLTDIKKKIVKEKEIKIHNSYRDFISIKNVIKFLNFSIENDIKGIFNLGSGKSYSLIKIIKKISKKVKKKPILKINNKKDYLISDNAKLKKIRFELINEKNFNI